MENKEVAFLNYAKTKGWDASLCFYDGVYMAILNPVNVNKVYEGTSDMTIGEAIENCKKELTKKKG